MDFKLSAVEQAELVRRATSGRGGSREARRARLILLMSRGSSWRHAMKQLHCGRAFIARWLHRFREARVAGLMPHHRGSLARVATARLEAQVLRLGAKRRGDGTAQWTTRSAADHVGVSHMTVQRIWRRNDAR